MDEQDILVYGGVDWATEEHVACAVARDGTRLGECTVSSDAGGLERLCQWFIGFGASSGQVAVGIEVPHGAVVETLMDRGFSVYSINPKQLDRFRDRFSPAGAKDDSRDALVLADSLRTDTHCYRRLNIDRPEVVELREWSRMYDELRRERVRMANRLREQLRRYHVQLLALGEDVGDEWFLALWELVPTPLAGHRIREKTLAAFLRRHRLRKLTVPRLLEVLRQPGVTVAEGTESAAKAHVALLVERLRVVNRQLKDCSKQLERLCNALAPEPPPKEEAGQVGPEHHEVAILRSLPGIGTIVLGVVLGEAWWAVQARDYETLRALSGVAPITRRSGKSRIVVMRQACNPRLRHALYHWSRVSIQIDPASRAKYSALRARGKSHGRALRTVADRLLTVACAMLRSGNLYDPNIRAAAEEQVAV